MIKGMTQILNKLFLINKWDSSYQKGVNLYGLRHALTSRLALSENKAHQVNKLE